MEKLICLPFVFASNSQNSGIFICIVNILTNCVCYKFVTFVQMVILYEWFVATSSSSWYFKAPTCSRNVHNICCVVSYYTVIEMYAFRVNRYAHDLASVCLLHVTTMKCWILSWFWPSRSFCCDFSSNKLCVWTSVMSCCFLSPKLLCCWVFFIILLVRTKGLSSM